MANLQHISSPVERARCVAVPALATFLVSVDPAVDTNPDAFWNCSDAFTTLMQSTFLADVVAWELDCLRRDPDYAPCPRGERDLEILRVGRLSLSVRVQIPEDDAPRSLLYGFCEHHISANVGPGSLQIQRWMQGSEGPPEIFDRTRGLVSLPPVLLRPGEQASFQAHRDVARISAVDSAAVVVGLTRACATRVRWVYDAATLLPVRAEAGDLAAARLEYAMMLLAALEHTEAAPTIASLCDHPDHFVRWSAVRRVMELDASLGESLVRHALNDIHPHVRRAAQRSIERYEAMRATAGIQERTHGPHA
jgi:hypothetical protein